MDTALAPAFSRWTYTGASGIHHGIVPVNIVDGWVAGTEPDLRLKDGTTLGYIEAMTNFIASWKKFAASNQNIGLAEIYAVDADTGEGTFVFGFDLATSGEVGTSVAKLGTQITFKLVNGRTYRALWMENSVAQDTQQFPPFADASPQKLFSEYAVDDASIIYGRGNAYPFAPMRLLSKEYDALRKRTGLG